MLKESTKKFHINFINNFKIIFEIIIFLYVFILFILSNLKKTNLNIFTNITINVALVAVLAFFALLVIIFENKYFISYRNIFKKIISMDLLIAIAGHVSFLYSLINFFIKIGLLHLSTINMEFFEVSIVLFLFFNIGKKIESKIQLKSNSGLKDLLKLKNKTSYILVNGTKEEIPTFKIKPNDSVVVAKGQTIPIDGKLLSEDALLDYSSITGESFPVRFSKNEEILSGSINLSDLIIVKATKTSNQSFLSLTINRLETIFEQPSRIERISVKIVKFLIPSILLISFLSFLGWIIAAHLIGGFNNVYSLFQGPRNSGIFAGAIHVAIAVLVICCPCAFGIAAPIAIYSSSILSSKNKILFANAKVYERLLKAKFIVFDKTGTITEGKPKVKNYQGDDKNLKIAKLMAQNSNHPMSLAINLYIKVTDNKIIKTTETPGVGLNYIDELNNSYELVSYNFAKNNNFFDLEKFNFDEVGNYTILAKNKSTIGVFLIVDDIKSDAKQTIKLLESKGFKCVIASGDNKSNVENIAKQVGILEFYYNLNPFDKEKLINDLKSKGPVIFIGDGINDILATKSADLSISFENGSNLNNSISDVSLLTPDLKLVYKTIEIVRRTNKLVKMNFIWAISFNSIFIPIAISGLIFPVVAMSLMFFSSTFLILNTIFFKVRNEKFLSKNIF